MESLNPDFDPNLFYSTQTWERFGNGCVTVGVDEDDEDFEEAGLTGGEKEHTLITSEMPSHNHGYVVYASNGNAVSGYGHLATYSGYSGSTKGWSSNVASAGGSAAHNNIQPYIAVYRWVRTA